MNVRLVLASSSTSRRMMLEAAGVSITIAMPSIDEDVVKSLLIDGGNDAYVIAEELAKIGERSRFIRRDRRTAHQRFENGKGIDLGGTGHGRQLSCKQDARPQWPGAFASSKPRFTQRGDRARADWDPWCP